MNYKKEFSVFEHFPDLCYLDSAASAQKPKTVIKSIQSFSEASYANIHRGDYFLSQRATDAYEGSRERVSSFLGISPKELVFTKNGTEAANIFIAGYSELLCEGDEVLIPLSEHHANFVPWLRAKEKQKIHLVFVEPNEKGVFSIENFRKKISPKTKAIAFAHVSNVTGQIFPVEEIVALAKSFGAMTLLDACQSVPHLSVDFCAIGVDAAFFTGHKLGAGGTGGLYMRESLFDKIPPLLVGGDMIDSVSLEGFIPKKGLQKFEGGTPAIENIVGLGAAVEFLSAIGMENIRIHEKELLEYAIDRIASLLPQFRIIGTQDAEGRSGLLSLVHEKIHHSDISAYLAAKNICIRTGFHCSEPIHHFLDSSGSVRASFWIYTEKKDIDRFIEALVEGQEMFLRG